MAFTKVGNDYLVGDNDMTKEALASMITGEVQAGNLSSAEAEALRQHYGLDDDASLG